MTSLLVDTAPLVLLVVGFVDPDLIFRHKNTSEYGKDDLHALISALGAARRLFVTPHIITETSSLLRQIGGQNRMLLSAGLRTFLSGFEELPIASRRAMDDSNYIALGVADAATLSALDGNTAVLTADADLYGAVLRRGGQATLFRPAAGRY